MIFLLLRNFKFYWTLHYIITSIVIGSIIAGIDNIYFIDGLFTAASAMANAGLSSIPMTKLSRASFILTLLIMTLGCPQFMILPTLIYRRYRFSKINRELVHTFVRTSHPKNLTYQNLKVIRTYYLLYESLGMLILIVTMYYLLWVFLGIPIIYAALRRKPLDPELQARGYSYIDNAAYLTISAFTNTGYTITSDSLIGMSDNPSCYVLLTVLILAGNTAFPIFLRYFIEFLLYCDKLWAKYIREEKPNHFSVKKPYDYYFNRKTVLVYILNNPHGLITYLFTDRQTKILMLMLFGLIFIQYACFLLSILVRPRALRAYHISTLLGIGYFQTLSTRTCGFSIIDLRLLSEGIIFIYMVMMYLAAFPFVTALNSKRLEHEEIDEKDVLEDYRHLEEDYDYKVKKDSRNILKEQLKTINKQIIQKTLHTLVVPEDETKDQEYEEGRPRRYSVGSLASVGSIKGISGKQGSSLRRQGSARRFVKETQRREINAFSESILEIQESFQEPPPPPIDDNPITVVRKRSSFYLGENSKKSNNSSERNFEKKDNSDEEDNEEVSNKNVKKGERVSFSSVIDMEKDRTKAIQKLKDADSLEADNELNTRILFGKKFLFRHTFFLFLAVLILAYSEDGLISHSQNRVNLWYIIFEVVSAYGSVGLTIGIPGKSYSLSGGMSDLGKMVMIFVFWLGKHRGLPNQDDDVIDFNFMKFHDAYLNSRFNRENDDHENESDEDDNLNSNISANESETEDNRGSIISGRDAGSVYEAVATRTTAADDDDDGVFISI